MTVKKFQVNLNKSLGKPYSQQAGRKQGKGAGHIKEGAPDELSKLAAFIKKYPTKEKFIQSEMGKKYKDFIGREVTYSGQEHEIRNSGYYYDAVKERVKNYPYPGKIRAMKPVRAKGIAEARKQMQERLNKLGGE